jgi:hypothetical protein
VEASAPARPQPPTSHHGRVIGAVTVAAGLGSVLAFALTVYLALSGGGYDIVARSDLGVLVWWFLLLGVIAGLLPRRRLGRATWIASGLLAGFFVWTWLGAGWSRSEELSLVEVGRVGTYAGVFVLAACALSGDSAQALVRGVAAGIAVVCALAVLSKLVPSLYPADPTAHFYATTRLRYPFDYSDGVGEFAALGIPLLWYLATAGRSIWGRALAAAGLPVVLLCLAMTVSRGGILAAAVGTVVFLGLSPDRLPRLLTGVVAAIGTLALMLALLARKGLTDTLFLSAPAGQRHSMLVIVVVVVIAVGGLQALLSWAGSTRARPGWTVPGRAATRATAAVVITVIVAGVAAFLATGAAGHLWTQFKQPNATASSNSYFRLLSVAGSHRYQYWQVALHAFESSPWKGIGPGTFQYYWAQHQTLGEYVLNAHSLWIETLAELGIIGLALIGGFFAWILIRGSLLTLSAPLPQERALRAGAVAAVAAFCAAAAFDWVWQIGVIPMVTMLLCAVTINPRTAPLSRRPVTRMWMTRLGLGAAALIALWTIVVPLGATVEVRRSQTAAQQGNWAAALRDAADAQALEPGAASPRLQQALLLEQAGDIQGAAAAVAAAAVRSPLDWQIWLVASRIATEQNRPRVALRDYRRARALNPRSPIFAG